MDEITSIDAAPRLNRMGTAEDWDDFIGDIEEDIKDELREKY